ncbi:Dipeptidyl-peptidase 5 [Penicillium lividum]|nr:Dipeptidyl-peptidase 5 [Penicillium lividum]
MPSDSDNGMDHMDERDRTRQCVREFLSTTTDKYFLNMEIRPFMGKRHWLSWLSTIHMQLRMHQVWEVVGENLMPLDEDDELFYGYERMKDVGCELCGSSL